MPVTVKVPTLLRPHVGGVRAVEATGGTLRELFEDLERRYPGVTHRVVGPDGDLHRFVNVYLNDEDVRYLGALDARVNEGDTVAILPAVAGGRRPSDARVLSRASTR
jgi:sulfur-carrier protein